MFKEKGLNDKEINSLKEASSAAAHHLRLLDTNPALFLDDQCRQNIRYIYSWIEGVLRGDESYIDGKNSRNVLERFLLTREKYE